MHSNRTSNGRSQSFPFKTRFAHLSDGPVAYFDDGSGDAIVFVHGLVGDFTHFEHVAAKLSDSFRVAGIDLPGCGISCKPLSRHSVDNYGKTLLDWMSFAGIERATLVGHSAGGPVCASAARLAPSRVERLVLLSSAGLRRFSPAVRLLARAVLRPWVLRASLEKLSMPMLNQVFFTRNEYTEKFIADSLNRPVHPTLGEMAKVFHDLAPDLVSSATLERIAELGMPMLIIWGDSDKLVDEAALIEVASMQPGTTFKRVTQCGHMPMIEKPAEVVETLRSFLTTQSSSASRSSRTSGVYSTDPRRPLSSGETAVGSQGERSSSVRPSQKAA